MDMSPESNGRFAVSLLVLALLATLAWQTMEPGKYQQLTWLLLGFFVLRIVLARVRSRYSKNGVVAGSDLATSDGTERP